MTKFQFSRIAAATAVAVLSCSGAFAADSQSMTVQANVSGICKLAAVPTLDFGTLNQVTAPDFSTAAVNVQYRCTKGTAPTTFTVGGSGTGSYTGSLSNTIDTIAYTITWTTPSTAGSGLGSGVTPVNVPLVGNMLGANYQNVSAGTYSQSVAVAITL